MITVHLVTSIEPHCGVAEYARMLKAAVEIADPEIAIVLGNARGGTTYDLAARNQHADLVHLNYHEATMDVGVAQACEASPPLIVTYHNTFGEHTPEELRASGDHRLDLLEEFCAVADAVVVHEPCKGLTGNVQVIRQGVPAAGPKRFYDTLQRLQYPHQPVLGTLGFPFPWKNYDRLCSITAEAGWALLLIAPTATETDVARWTTLNPYIHVRTDFVPAEDAVSLLAGCDATAFLYEGAFAGTSGAVRMGIAARKPVILFEGQRQMRDLLLEYPSEFCWAGSWEDVPWLLKQMPIQRVDPAMVYVAEQDSWARAGQKYAALYRSLLS